MTGLCDNGEGLRSTRGELPKHYHLKLDYGLPTERIVSFATQAERLEAAKAALQAERRKP